MPREKRPANRQANVCTPTSLSHVLAAGVYWSGFVKDLLCLPRPLSPPLQRISRSASAALEYGFPSTHSTNSVSVAVYLLLKLSSPSHATLHQPLLHLARALTAFYALSITLGRLYCGMHGLLDVLVGSLLGALLGVVQHLAGARFDAHIYAALPADLFRVALVLLALIWLHPEPADDCPCFDDSIAFAGVVLGLQLGAAHFARSGFAAPAPATPATVPYSLSHVGALATLARVLAGVLVIFAWRSATKPLLLRALPPVFRVVERAGLALPRRFFLAAS